LRNGRASIGDRAKAAQAERESIGKGAEQQQRLAESAPDIWHALGDAMLNDVQELNALRSFAKEVKRYG
jgi:hypothetical protein